MRSTSSRRCFRSCHRQCRPSLRLSSRSAQPEVRSPGLRCSPGSTSLQRTFVSLPPLLGMSVTQAATLLGATVFALLLYLLRTLATNASSPALPLLPLLFLPLIAYSPLLGPAYTARNRKPVSSTPTLQLRLSFPPRPLLCCRHP